MVLLWFLVIGLFYIIIGDILSILKSIVGRVVRLVMELLCRMIRRFICFLLREEIVNIKVVFYKIVGKKVVCIFDYDFKILYVFWVWFFLIFLMIKNWLIMYKIIIFIF